ncbi:MAG: preprotein translocase subunit YajC, partial [Deltaproteobacteria bacterium]|nr:preprotein translocase subunit YajC [Deltaproteobacteria bacterium]
LIIIFAIFYFLLIRPQQKRAKDQRSFLDSLSRGEEVITTGGLIGKITGLTDDVVTLEVADKVKVKVVRAQIAGKPPTTNK